MKQGTGCSYVEAHEALGIGAAAITKLNKNGDKLKWYNDGGMLTIGYKFEMK